MSLAQTEHPLIQSQMNRSFDDPRDSISGQTEARLRNEMALLGQRIISLEASHHGHPTQIINLPPPNYSSAGGGHSTRRTSINDSL
jgi:hypothetical protein